MLIIKSVLGYIMYFKESKVAAHFFSWIISAIKKGTRSFHQSEITKNVGMAFFLGVP